MIACLFCIKNQKKKLSPLAKTTSYMSSEKKYFFWKRLWITISALSINLDVNSRKYNSKMNHTHKRTLEIVYNDNILSFEELLKKDNSYSICQCFFRVSQKCPWKKCKIYIFCHKRRIIFSMHVKFPKETCLAVWIRIHKFSRAF